MVIFSATCPAFLAAWHLSKSPRLLDRPSGPRGLPNRSVPGEFTRAATAAFGLGGWTWLHSRVFTLFSPLAMWQLVFDLLLDVVQGFLVLSPHPHSSSTLPSNCFLFLAPTLSMTRQVLFLSASPQIQGPARSHLNCLTWSHSL